MALSWDMGDIERAEDVLHHAVADDTVVYSARHVAPGVVVLTGATGGGFASWLVRTRDATVLGTFRDSEEAVRAARRNWNAHGGAMS